MIRNSFLILFFLSAAIPAQAIVDQFGLGVMLGEPTGLSGKYWTTSKTAVDMGVAWSFREETQLQLHADYLFHFPIGNVARQSPLFYVGVGGYVKAADENDSRIGLRIPFGIAILPRKTPLEIFIEAVPVVDIAPATDAHMQAAFGLRYYFP